MKERSIEWGVSWNPVKGKCPHPCWEKYCYMKGYFDRFNPNPQLRLDEKTLAHPPKAPLILVCSSTDLFAKEIPDEWITRVVDKIREYPDQRFFLLTKRPARYSILKNILSNIWCGTSWDGLPFTDGNVRKLVDAALHLAYLFVSFEPLLAEPKDEDIAGIEYLDWVIIGADSRPGAKKPPVEWAGRIIERAREFGIPVFVKSNYGYPEAIQEFP